MLVCVGGSAALLDAYTQQPSAPAQAQPAAPTDPGVQIDELIRQSNEAMNVKVQFQRSEELARQALELSEKVGDKGRAAMAMVYLESAIAYQGRFSEALEIAQKNVRVARESGDKKVQEQALNSLASITGEMGRYEEALGIFYECLALAREINDPTMQYMSLLNIGEGYVRSDDPDKAELPLRESLRIARELKPNLRASNPSKKATEMALLNLGGMEMARQHYRAALDYYEQVHVSKPESSLWVVAALQGMAASYEQLGAPQKAIELLDQAIPIAEKSASGAEYRNLLSALGVNQEKLGDLDAALASENKALALMHEAAGDPDSEWQVESRIAHIERARGNNDQALEHYRNAISGIELLRSVALNTEEGRAGVVERSRATYSETADLLIGLHRQNEALEVAERGRARAFLDMLAMSRSGVPDERTPEQRKQEDSKLARITAVQKQLWKPDLLPAEEKKIKAELTSAEDDLERFHVEVRRSNPRYAGIHYPEPVSVSLIQKNLLDNRTVLAEFLLGEKRSLLWVVSKQKLIVGVLPPRKEVEDEVTAYRKALMEKTSALTLQASLSEIQRRGRHLYGSLFQSVANAIPPGSTLLIVPDGNLGYLPFESLIIGNHRASSGEVQPVYMLDRFAITYGPSASALAAVRENNKNQERPKILLAFGDPVVQPETVFAKSTPANAATRSADTASDANPDRTTALATPPAASSDAVSQQYAERGFSLTRLPFTRDEVLGIGNLYPAAQRQLYLGEDAREETVKSEKLDAYRYIHFASHGFIDEAHPERSGILFSRSPHSDEDGVLQMGEIMRLKLNADLVTLSACSTGLGKLVNGEGALGLTRAFFYAGARNVTVSLWNVNDSATAALMKSFYGNLNRGLPKSAALRQAKLSLLRGVNPLWRHPYFWAAFVLVGEGN